MATKENIIREVRIFEFYVKWIWPIHRKLAGRLLSKRCKQCILPETYAPLVDGLCPHCIEDKDEEVTLTEAKKKKMQKEFDTLMRNVMKKKDLQYHVMVLFSGGKDSSYLLHRLRNEYPDLRMLAVTVDNTFMSPVAMENIQEIIKILDIDHMMMRPPAATMEKMFSYAFTHLNEKGCSGTVDQFDGDFFSDLSRNLAAKMGIPYIICGLSPDQVENILGLTNFITDAAEEAKERKEVAGIKLKDVFNKDEMKFWWNGKLWPANKRARMVFPFYIWDLEEDFIKAEVLRLGLMPRGDESPLITNHRLIPLMCIVDMIQFGFASFEPEFARNVRKGKSDRMTWIHMFEMFEYSAKTSSMLSSAIDEVLDRLKLSREDVGLKGKK